MGMTTDPRKALIKNGPNSPNESYKFDLFILFSIIFIVNPEIIPPTSPTAIDIPIFIKAGAAPPIIIPPVIVPTNTSLYPTNPLPDRADPIKVPITLPMIAKNIENLFKFYPKYE